MSPPKLRLRNPGILIGLIAALLVCLLYFLRLDFLESVELKILDTHFRIRGSLAPSGEVIIAAIDEKSLERFGRWPWPRSRLAALIDFLSQAQARVISLDILFSEPDHNSELATLRSVREELVRSGLSSLERGKAIVERLHQREQEADSDARFEQALKKAQNVVLPLYFEFRPNGPAGSDAEAERLVSRSGIQVLANLKDRGLFSFPQAKGVVSCLPAFAEAAWGVGHINMMADRDGVVRWELGVIEYQDSFIPSLALRSASAYLGLGSQDLSIYFGEGLGLGDIRIPTDEHGRFLINYLGPAGTFPRYSVADILEGRVPPSVFQGKIVLVGATAVGIYDLRVTPFSVHFPGVEKHANTIDNLLHQRFLICPAWMGLLELLAVLLVPLFLGYVLPKLRPWQGFLLSFFLLACLLMVAHALFTSGRAWLRILYPSLGILLSFGGVESHKLLVEEAEKRRIRGAFQRYVPPAVVEEILSHPDKLKFGGERRELTVLFSDIRGFTTYTEKYPPEQVVEVLNEYLTAMVEVIFRHQGTLDKFVGDEIMALYGAPIYYPDHAERACRSALDMVAELKRLCAKWEKEGREGFEIGIGINTGEMVVGNLGSSQLFDYTVIGDNVNLGSRLEAINKEYQTRHHIIISEFTYERIRERAAVRELGEVTVKGKTRPVRIFELLGMDGEKEGEYLANTDSAGAIGGTARGEGKGS